MSVDSSSSSSSVATPSRPRYATSNYIELNGANEIEIESIAAINPSGHGGSRASFYNMEGRELFGQFRVGSRAESLGPTSLRRDFETTMSRRRGGATGGQFGKRHSIGSGVSVSKYQNNKPLAGNKSSRDEATTKKAVNFELPIVEGK